MGGQNETVMPAKTVETTPGATKTVGKVRYHINGAEVHFHDDDSGIKISVPVADWFAGWQDLESGKVQEWTHADLPNRACLCVNLLVTEGKLDVALSINMLVPSNDFTALADFTTAGASKQHP